MLSVLRYCLLSPVRPLARLYLKTQSRKHMDYAFHFLIKGEPEQANAHRQQAESFRRANTALRRDRTLRLARPRKATQPLPGRPHETASQPPINRRRQQRPPN